MALKDLSVPVMLAVSSRWLDSNEDRPVFVANPVLEAGLADIEEAHIELLNTQERAGSVEATINNLTRMLTSRDSRHDRKARGIDRVIDGAGELADDEDEKAELVELRTTLFPNGLSVTRASYLDQAGSAIQIRKELTPEVRRRLAGFRLHHRNLLTEVLDWLETADEIGRLVDQRAKLQGDEDPDAVTRADMNAARGAWIRATRNLFTLLDVARVDATTRRKLLASLHKAERDAMASKRNSAAKAGKLATPVDLREPESPEVPELPEVPEEV